MTLYCDKLNQTEKIHINRLGDGCIEGKHYYCIGNDIISDVFTKNDCCFEPAVSQFHIDYDKSISRKDAFKTYERCLGIELGTTDIIGLYAVKGFMRELFNLAKLPMVSVLMLTRHTQQQKTTLAELLCNPYNTDKTSKASTIRLDSSVVSIEEFIEERRTSTVIVDDLFRDSMKQTDLKYKAQQIVRQAADKTVRQTSRTANDITQTQIIITSEIIFDNISDLGRVLLVMPTGTINSERLSKCTHERRQLLAFYVHYISWLYKNFDKLVEDMRDDVAMLEFMRLQKRVQYERLREQCFMLSVTLKYVLRYAVENRCISEEYSKQLHERIIPDIKHCYDTQLSVMKYIAKLSDENKLMPSKALWVCLRTGKIMPGDEDSDCFIRHNNDVEFLWIRSELLTFELNSLFKHENSAKYYANYFSKRGILVREANGKRNSKRHNGLRYMVIRLDLLAADVNSIESIVDTFL